VSPILFLQYCPAKSIFSHRNTTITGGLPATSGNLARGIILAYCFAIQYIIVYFIIIQTS
jgi:hypothetical protein